MISLIKSVLRLFAMWVEERTITSLSPSPSPSLSFSVYTYRGIESRKIASRDCLIRLINASRSSSRVRVDYSREHRENVITIVRSENFRKALSSLSCF